MRSIFIPIMLLLNFLVFSCANKVTENDPKKLCINFYNENRNMDLNRLLDVGILTIREYSKYNELTEKNERIPLFISLIDTIERNYIIVPSFSRNASVDEKKLFFSRCDSACISYFRNRCLSKESIFETYKKTIDSIYSVYYKIKIPEELPYENIEINGDGFCIEFVLYKNDHSKVKYSCFYFKDSISKQNITNKHFQTLIKLDDHWYYKIK